MRLFSTLAPIGCGLHHALVHAWDSLLAFDVSDAMVGYARGRGIFPSQRHILKALDKIETLGSRIACHHGCLLRRRVPVPESAPRDRHHDHPVVESVPRG